jgi:hypothetical protein
MRMWMGRAGAVLAALSIAALARRDNEALARGTVLSSLVVTALVLMVRVRRLLRIETAALVATALFTVVVGVLIAVAAGVDRSDVGLLAPWVGAIAGTVLLFVCTADAPGVFRGRLLVLLDRRVLRPVSFLVDLRVRAIFADVAVDLSRVDTLDVGGFVDVIAVASQVEIVVPEPAKGLVVHLPADAAALTEDSPRMLVLQQRCYAGGIVTVRYAPVGGSGRV